MRCTSALDMHSKNKMHYAGGNKQLTPLNPPLPRGEFRGGDAAIFFRYLLLAAVYCLLSTVLCSAELIDRVVAFVDDEAITLSDLDENYSDTKKIKPDIKKEEVLNTMINRILLLREAKKLRIEASTKDEIIHEYIELKLKTFIKTTEEDIKDFYAQNKREFGKADFDDVRDKIEEYLIENEVNLRLKKHIEELRLKAYIKVQY